MLRGLIQLFAAVQEPLLASHPARQLLASKSSQAVFVHVLIGFERECVCVKIKGKEGVDRLSVGDLAANVTVRL